MAILIDTSVIIAVERGRLELATSFWRQSSQRFFLSAITVSELLHGVHRATTESIGAARLQFVDFVIDRVNVLPIDVPVARTHAEIWARQEGAGMLIGPHDLWIAATCLYHGLSIATMNDREFQRVPGLTVFSPKNWSASE
jgi:tRNA(fMet)-specific endonuclease VapC